MRRSRAVSDAHARRRGGMTVVELIVAIVLLTIGLLGLASTSAAVLRQMRVSGKQSIATAVAASRFERFEGRPCAQITAGTATTRGITESWTVSPFGSRAMLVRDSLFFKSPTGTRKIGLVTVVSCTS